MREKQILKLQTVVTNNWGSNDHMCVPLFGNKHLILGHNGSGKSTMLNAIQTICYGSFHTKYFNKADASNNAEVRTALSHLRGATKFNPQGSRAGHTVTGSLALEWHDELRDIWYVTGAIFDSVSQFETKNIPDHTWFIINGRIPSDEFLNYHLSDIKLLVAERKSEHDSRPGSINQIFNTDESYRHALYERVFGGIDYKTFEVLQTSSVSTNLNLPTDEYIKQYMFPVTPDKENEELTERLATFTWFKKQIEESEKVLEELEILTSLITEYEEESKQLSFLEEETDYITAKLYRGQAESDKQLAQETEDGINVARDKATQYRMEKGILDKHWRDLSLALDKTDYQAKKNEVDAKREVRKAKESQMAELDKTRAELRKWLENETINEYLTNELLNMVEIVCKGTPTPAQVKTLRSALFTARETIKDEENAAREDRNAAKKDLADARDVLEGYKSDTFNYRNKADILKVKESLERRLAAETGVQVPVEILSRTFNVTDPEWKNAIEACLPQKSYLIVPPEYSTLAMKIHRRELKVNSVRLVNSKMAMEKNAVPKQGSLYECVSKEKDYVDAVLRFYLGHIIRCDSEEELEHAGNGVTRDCYTYRGIDSGHADPITYTRYASIGKSVPKEVIRQQEARVKKLEALYDAKLAVWESFNDASRYNTLDRTSDEELIALTHIPEEIRQVSKEIEALEKVLKTLETGEVSRLQGEIRDTEEQIKMVDSDIKNTDRRIYELETSLSSRRESYRKNSEKAIEIESRYRDGFSHEAVKDASAWFAKHPNIKNPDTAENDLKELRTRLEIGFERTKNKLETGKDRFNNAHPSYGFDNTVSCNGKMLAEYDRLKNEYDASLLPRYAEAREAAEISLRRNKINHLHDMISGADEQRHLYNSLLRKNAFGNDQYILQIGPANNELGEFYEMLTAKELDVKPDAYDNQISFDEMAFNEKYKDTIDKYMSLFTMPLESEFSGPRAAEEYKRACSERKKIIARASDFRSYLSFRLMVRRADKDDDAKVMSASSSRNSTGEERNVKYVAICAGFLRLYDREFDRAVSPGLILMDEAFNDMDGERIHAVMNFMDMIGLQPILITPKLARELEEEVDSIIEFSTDDDYVTYIAVTDKRKLSEKQQSLREEAAWTGAKYVNRQEDEMEQISFGRMAG